MLLFLLFLRSLSETEVITTNSAILTSQVINPTPETSSDPTIISSSDISSNTFQPINPTTYSSLASSVNPTDPPTQIPTPNAPSPTEEIIESPTDDDNETDITPQPDVVNDNKPSALVCWLTCAGGIAAISGIVLVLCIKKQPDDVIFDSARDHLSSASVLSSFHSGRSELAEPLIYTYESSTN